MPFDTIFFDLDGTLTDSADGIIRSVVYALDKLSCPTPPDAVLRKFLGPPLLHSFTEYCGLTEAQAMRAIDLYRERFSTVGLFENRVYDGVEPMLRKLKAAGKRLAVATSKPEAFSIRILEHFSLAQYFDKIAGSNLNETRTHKDEVIAYALDECRITDKRTVVMVGDREHDILGAKWNGLFSVGVLYGYGDRPEMEAAGADRIAETVDALCALLLD